MEMEEEKLHPSEELSFFLQDAGADERILIAAKIFRCEEVSNIALVRIMDFVPELRNKAWHMLLQQRPENCVLLYLVFNVPAFHDLAVMEIKKRELSAEVLAKLVDHDNNPDNLSEYHRLLLGCRASDKLIRRVERKLRQVKRN